MPSDRDRRARSRSAHHAPSSGSRPLAVFTPRRRPSGVHSGSGGSGGDRATGGAHVAYGGGSRLVTPPSEPLEPRTRKFLVRLANDTSNHLIRDSLEQDEPGSVLWKPFSVVRGVDVFRGVEREHAEATDAACLRGATDVSASIEEFALLFKLDSSGPATSRSSSGSGHGGGGSASSTNGHGLLFDADLQDMVTLYPIVLPSGDHPRRFVGIKWCLVGAPSRLFRRRDFCFLECQKEFTDGRGRRGWVRSMHSVKLPTVPSLEKPHGIVRASLYRSGLTVVETNRPGVLRVTYTVEMDLKGRLPERLLPNLIAQRISRLADIDRFLQTQRLSSSPLLGDLDLADGFLADDKDSDVILTGPNRHRRAACQLCYRAFSGSGLLGGGKRSKRFVCRKCGESVCKNCSDDWLLDVPVIGQTMVRICTVCSAEAKHSHTVNATAAVAASANTRQQDEEREERLQQEEKHAFDRRTYRDQQQQEQQQQQQQQQRRVSHRVPPPGQERLSRRVVGEEGRRDPAMRRRSLSMDNTSFDSMVDERSLYSNERNTHHVRTAQQVAPPEVRFDRAQIDRVHWRGPAQRQTLVDDDDDDDDSGPDDDSRDQFDEEPVGGSIDRPSFMSLERDPNSISGEPEFFGAIASPSAPPIDDEQVSELSDDQEELTIDGAGEIRATADLTRWWTDETAQKQSAKPQPMSGGGIVHGVRNNAAQRTNVVAQREERATWHNNNPVASVPAAPMVVERSQTMLSPAAVRASAMANARRAQRPQSARAVMTPVRRDAAEQERMDLLSHYQRQSAVTPAAVPTSTARSSMPAVGIRHPYQQQQRQPVVANRTNERQDEDEDEDEVTIPPPPQHQERMSQLQRIREHQQRQQELLRQRQLAYQRSQQQQQRLQVSTDRPQQDASERDPHASTPSSMAAALAASTSSAATSSSLSSMGSSSSGQSSGVGNFTLPSSSIIASDTSAVGGYEDSRFASSSSTNSSDQTAGEISEYIETASGQWVSRGNTSALAPPPSVIKAASAKRQAMREEPGFCVRCGAPEYLGDRGNVLRSCECVVEDVNSGKQSAARTIQLEGRVISGASSSDGNSVQVAVDVEQVIPLIVERLSHQSLLPPFPPAASS